MKSGADSRPPRWMDRFLEWYCADELLEEIQGDLYEAYRDRLTESGAAYARRRYFMDVLRFFKLSNIHPRLYTINTFSMFRNHLKIALRHFKKYKVDSSINLLGLVLGVASCLLIGLYVLEETSYDNFHPAGDRTYRLVMNMYENSELTVRSAPIYPAVGPALLQEFPEVEAYTRILPFGGGVYSRRDEDGGLVRYNEDKAVMADGSFFDLFGFRLLRGDKDKALAGKNQIVLSASTARKYFGKEDPIGKILVRRGQDEMTVTGIMEDFPKNSHMQFDMIYSLASLDGFEELPQVWGWYDFYTFVRLKPGTDRAQFDKKIAVFLDEKKKEDYKKLSQREELWSQPIADIHLHSTGVSWDMGNNGGAYRVYFLSAIAILVLVIAWINFVNLNTARAVKRAHEVGVRKVVGAQRGNLIRQFLSEAFLYNLASILLAVALLWLIIPVVNRFFDLELSLRALLTWQVSAALVGLALLGGFISGGYPARVLAAFEPLAVIRGRFVQNVKKVGFRQALVVFQFVISTVLILGTILVVRQLRFMQSHDLGLNIEQTLVLKAPTSGTDRADLQKRLGLFREELKQVPEVQGMTISGIVPGIENFNIGGFSTRHTTAVLSCYRVRVDEHFFSQFDIDLLAGRTFRRDMPTDSFAVLLNKNAVYQMGFESPEAAIGEKLDPDAEQPLTIIGVVGDYYQKSVREPLDPVVFFFSPDAGSYYSLKIKAADYKPVMDKIQKEWDAIYPDNPFDYFFLDERFAQQYANDRRFNTLFTFFALLGILIACMGLYGLVSFTTEQRRKEIGIRKVLGAPIRRVIVHLLREYAVLLMISVLIAFPLSWWLMQRWLDNFAYRTSIDWSIFAVGVLFVFATAFLTVIFKSFEAARRNPSGVLRGDS